MSVTNRHFSLIGTNVHRMIARTSLLALLANPLACSSSDSESAGTGGTTFVFAGGNTWIGNGGATFAPQGGATATVPATSNVGGTPTNTVGTTSTANGGTGSTPTTSSFGGSTYVTPTDCGQHTGFWVDGRFLRDRCCEKVVLRGINEMIVWSAAKNGTPYFAEIAQTGANVVRIVWETAGTLSNLESAIKNAIDAHLIPMPELHDATGDLTKLGPCIDFWVRSDVVAVLKKYEDKLLINIANEVGDGSVTQAAFTTAYTDAITKMRTAGLHVPLVIDAPSWGQDVNMLQAAGPGLIAADPDHNLLFSVHMWWNDPKGTRVTTELTESANMNLPLIVGEFAQHAVYQCSAGPFDYKTLLAKAKELEIGYLAWSWGGIKNGDCKTDGPFDMTTAGTFATLTGWGLEVAVTDPNSIKNTAVRSRYMTTGSCQ
jgi:mannan endo-1,4-beta-mannosidase